MISVIMPVYNGEKYLREAIESVINQTELDWELIVVNDGSIDSSLSIMREYEKKDSRIKVIENPYNMGISNTINNGFAHASGEYYTWTSDDNLYKENALYGMRRFLEQNKEYGLVYSDSDVIDGQGNLLRNEGYEPEEIFCYSIVGGSFMYTKEAAELTGGYTNEFPLAQDYDFFLRMSMRVKVGHLPDNNYIYRQHDGNLTARKSEQLNYELYLIRLKYFKYMFGEAKGDVKDKLFLDFFFQNPKYGRSIVELVYGELPETIEWINNLEEIKPQGRKAIFGCGENGKKTLELLGTENVECFIDNEIKKVGTKVCGVPIIHFDDYKREKGDLQIIVSTASRFLFHIAKQITDSGISGFASYLSFSKDVASFRDICIYCLGAHGIRTYYRLKDAGINVDMFGDKDASKRGYVFEGIECYGFDDIKKKDPLKTYIIVANNKPDKIIAAFKEAGFRRVVTEEEAYNELLGGEFVKEKEPVSNIEEIIKMKEDISSFYNNPNDTEEIISNAEINQIRSDYKRRVQS